jgi:hypothetical protein
MAQNLFFQFKDGADALLDLKRRVAKPENYGEKDGPFYFCLAMYPIDSIYYYPLGNHLNLSLMELFDFVVGEMLSRNCSKRSDELICVYVVTT